MDLEDDETERFLSRLKSVQKGLGNFDQGTVELARKSAGKASGPSDAKQAAKSLKAIQADDDECEALWGMFGVDDLDLEEETKKQPGKTTTAAPANPATSLGSKAAGSNFSGSLAINSNATEVLADLAANTAESAPRGRHKVADTALLKLDIEQVAEEEDDPRPHQPAENGHPKAPEVPATNVLIRTDKADSKKGGAIKDGGDDALYAALCHHSSRELEVLPAKPHTASSHNPKQPACLAAFSLHASPQEAATGPSPQLQEGSSFEAEPFEPRASSASKPLQKPQAKADKSGRFGESCQDMDTDVDGHRRAGLSSVAEGGPLSGSPMHLVSQGDAEEEFSAACSFGSVMEVCKATSGLGAGLNSSSFGAGREGLSCPRDAEQPTMAADLKRAEMSHPDVASEADKASHSGQTAGNCFAAEASETAKQAATALLKPENKEVLQQSEADQSALGGAGEEKAQKLLHSNVGNECEDASMEGGVSLPHERPLRKRPGKPMQTAAEKLPEGACPPTAGNGGAPLHKAPQKGLSSEDSRGIFDTKTAAKPQQTGNTNESSEICKRLSFTPPVLQKGLKAGLAVEEVRGVQKKVDSLKALQAPQGEHFRMGKAELTPQTRNQVVGQYGRGEMQMASLEPSLPRPQQAEQGQPFGMANFRTAAPRKLAKQAKAPVQNSQQFAKRLKAPGPAPKSFSFSRGTLRSEKAAEVLPTPDFQPDTSHQHEILGDSADPAIPPSGASKLQNQQPGITRGLEDQAMQPPWLSSMLQNQQPGILGDSANQAIQSPGESKLPKQQPGIFDDSANQATPSYAGSKLQNQQPAMFGGSTNQAAQPLIRSMLRNQQPGAVGGSENLKGHPPGRSKLQNQQPPDAASGDTHKLFSSNLKRKDRPLASKQLEASLVPGTAWQAKPGFGVPAAPRHSGGPRLGSTPFLTGQDRFQNAEHEEKAHVVTFKDAQRVEERPNQVSELPLAQCPQAMELPADVAAFLGKDYNALLSGAQEDLDKFEVQIHGVHTIDARLDRMQLELDEMHSKALELRVQAAIAANRLVRLDSPILFAKMDALKNSLQQLLNEP